MKDVSGNQDHVWRFMTNYSHVLVSIAANPTARLKDIAETVGVTERTAAQLLRNLEQAGYLTKTREGRRNRYEVHDKLPLRHPLHRHHTVGELIRFLQEPAAGRAGVEGAGSSPGRSP
jgi:DNA-binding transcriptional ArsR family regulator